MMSPDKYQEWVRARRQEWLVKTLPPSIAISAEVDRFCAEMTVRMSIRKPKPLTERQSYQEFRKLADELRKRYGADR